MKALPPSRQAVTLSITNLRTTLWPTVTSAHFQAKVVGIRFATSPLAYSPDIKRDDTYVSSDLFGASFVNGDLGYTLSKTQPKHTAI